MKEEYTLTDNLDGCIADWARTVAADVLGIPEDQVSDAMLAAVLSVAEEGLDEKAFKEAMKPKKPASGVRGGDLSVFDVEPDDSGYYRAR